jgi:hypothetical protein
MTFHYPQHMRSPSIAPTMAPLQVPTSSFSDILSPPNKQPHYHFRFRLTVTSSISLPIRFVRPSRHPSFSPIGVFECRDQVIVRVDAAGDKTTSIHLTVAYNAEVNRPHILSKHLTSLN